MPVSLYLNLVIPIYCPLYRRLNKRQAELRSRRQIAAYNFEFIPTLIQQLQQRKPSAYHVNIALKESGRGLYKLHSVTRHYRLVCLGSCTCIQSM